MLLNISKIFDNCMHRQISDYVEAIFSKFHAGFEMDTKGIWGLLTEISKAFDCHTQELVISKRQGSIPGPLLFNIFLCDLFLFQIFTGFVSFGDNSTPYSLSRRPEEVITI